MSVIEQLAQEFARFPGIGPKTATRLVYHLMKRPKEFVMPVDFSIADLRGLGYNLLTVTK
jgi:recombinational DNA repair protein RecR